MGDIRATLVSMETLAGSQSSHKLEEQNKSQDACRRQMSSSALKLVLENMTLCDEYYVLVVNTEKRVLVLCSSRGGLESHSDSF